jgi:hypothetical protein
MLKHAHAALAQLGLAPLDARLNFYVNITTGEAMSVSAFVDRARFFQIKASEWVDLAGEYAAYRRAFDDYADFVPRPLGYQTQGRWRMMVSEGIAHHPLPPNLIAHYRAAHDTGAMAGLMRFFEHGAKRAQRAQTSAAHAALLHELAQHFAASAHAPLAQRCIARSEREGVHALPVLAQHGDFVFNNLAAAGERLVVFDWEDYGKITLQGLDIATLAISVWGNDVERMHTLAQPRAALDAPMHAFLSEACARAGIEFELFRGQMPMYVLAFLYLKRNYGSAVQARFGELLRQLCVD